MIEKSSDDGYRLNTNSIIDSIEYDLHEKTILLIINRKILGGSKRKKSDKISISQFVKFGKVSKDTVIRTIKRLEEKNLIKIKRAKGREENRYSLNYSLFYSRSQLPRECFVVAVSDTHIERVNNNINFSEKDYERETETFANTMTMLGHGIVNKKAYSKTIMNNLYQGDQDTTNNYKIWKKFNSPSDFKTLEGMEQLRKFSEAIGVSL